MKTQIIGGILGIVIGLLVCNIPWIVSALLQWRENRRAMKAIATSDKQWSESMRRTFNGPRID